MLTPKQSDATLRSFLMRGIRLRGVRDCGRAEDGVGVLARVRRRVSARSFGVLLLCLQMGGAAGFCQQGTETTSIQLQDARALAVEGKLPQAEAVLRKVLQSDSSSADAHFLLGYVYFREQKAKKSLAEFTAGARTRRPGVSDLRIVASDYVLLNDDSDAAKWFGVVVSEEKDNPNDWYFLGRAQYGENRFEQAIASFKKVLALRPHDERAENNLGLAWQGLNEVEKAKQAFHNAIAWQGEHPQDAQPFLNLGILLINSGKPKEAQGYLKTAVGLAPQNPKIREQLARIYISQNKYAQAQSELEAAIAKAPKAAGLHFELGRVYFHEGLHDRAQKQFKICAQLNGSHGAEATPNPYTPK